MRILWPVTQQFKMEPLDNFVVTQRKPVEKEQVLLVEETMLPEGVWESDGELVAHCCSCGEKSPIYCDPHEFDEKYHYCNRSDRCRP